AGGCAPRGLTQRRGAGCACPYRRGGRARPASAAGIPVAAPSVPVPIRRVRIVAWIRNVLTKRVPLKLRGLGRDCPDSGLEKGKSVPLQPLLKKDRRVWRNWQTRQT